MARLIQVGNLPPSVDTLALRRLFERHGTVRSARIAPHFETGWNSDLGYIEMESEEAGATAIAALNHREHCGRVLSVRWNESSKGRVMNQRMFGTMNMMNDAVTGKEGDRQ